MKKILLAFILFVISPLKVFLTNETSAAGALSAASAGSTLSAASSASPASQAKYMNFVPHSAVYISFLFLFVREEKIEREAKMVIMFIRMHEEQVPLMPMF